MVGARDTIQVDTKKGFVPYSRRRDDIIWRDATGYTAKVFWLTKGAECLCGGSTPKSRMLKCPCRLRQPYPSFSKAAPMLQSTVVVCREPVRIVLTPRLSLALGYLPSFLRPEKKAAIKCLSTRASCPRPEGAAPHLKMGFNRRFNRDFLHLQYP